MNFFDLGEKIDDNTRFVIFGIPWDYLTSLEVANSALAPKKIREITANLALTTELGDEIPNLGIVDIGDVKILPYNVKDNLLNIEKYMGAIYKQNSNVIPIMIGGDHFCTYHAVKSIGNQFDKKEKLGVLVFDAHLDLYEKWDKGVYSHATISHRIFDLDYINKFNLLIVGARDIDIPELNLAKQHDIVHFDAYLVQEFGLNEYINNILDFYKTSKIENLYVSIDIDVLDPSIAPATGYAIPGGFSYRDLWVILKAISSQFSIIGFDLVEFSPNMDLINNITANVSAKIIIEFISFINRQKMWK